MSRLNENMSNSRYSNSCYSLSVSKKIQQYRYTSVECVWKCLKTATRNIYNFCGSLMRHQVIKVRTALKKSPGCRFCQSHGTVEWSMSFFLLSILFLEPSAFHHTHSNLFSGFLLLMFPDSRVLFVFGNIFCCFSGGFPYTHHIFLLQPFFVYRRCFSAFVNGILKEKKQFKINTLKAS